MSSAAPCYILFAGGVDTALEFTATLATNNFSGKWVTVNNINFDSNILFNFANQWTQLRKKF